MNIFFSPSPIWANKGLSIVRVMVGLLLVYHGLEVFNTELMKGYAEWDTFKGQSASFKVYAGKSAELVAGVLFCFGLLTRLSAILIIGTFSYITFFIGQGRFWYEDQHPFMFALFGLLFLFTGPGAWSLDGVIFKEKG
jgi:putative oxidoreductase